MARYRPPVRKKTPEGRFKKTLELAYEKALGYLARFAQAYKQNRAFRLACIGTAAALAVGVVLLIAIPKGTGRKGASLPQGAQVSRGPRISGQPLQGGAEAAAYRYIGHGAQNFSFTEKQIDLPSIFDKELAFSAGTGSVSSGQVLTNLYYYNIDTGTETRLAQAKEYMGEIYETLINHDWVVWLETDHGKKNIIYYMNRATADIKTVKNCENGMPKLRLYGNILVWMEQESETEDQLHMIDLTSMEDAELFTLKDKTSYGISAPFIYEDIIVWAGQDVNDAQSANSSIYWVPLGADTFTVTEDATTLQYTTLSPGTYVHEPKYNGDVFIWIDTNKSPNASLYICPKEGGNPKVIARGVTTYSIGDDIVVYGKDQGVWVYVISTGEICRLTYEGEKGQQPFVNNRTVVWYNTTTDEDRDVLRYKVLADGDLYPGQ